MILENADRAVVDIAKLIDYCLNANHPLGRNKARVFRSVLGITEQDAESLRDVLLNIVQTHDAVAKETDRFGRRYEIRFQLETETGTAIICSGWIALHEEDYPRLTTCYVDE